VVEDTDLWIVTVYQGKISLDNSSIWVLRASYGNATIQDSDISYLVAERESGDLQIDGCNIGWMGLTARSRGSQYHKISAVVENTAIESCMVNYWVVPFEVNVTFCNVVFNNLSMRPSPIFEAVFRDCKVIDTVTLYRMSAPEYNLNVRGSLDLTGARLRDYPNTVLKREYVVIVIQDDAPIEGLEVQVLKDGEIWKSGVTDEDGHYFFEAKWVNHTLSDNRWVPLESPVNNLTSSLFVRLKEFDDQQRVTVLSTSPVLLIANQRQDYLLKVAILLVIIIFIFLYRITRKIIN
jgi:hypothetical protein